jgi:hypothetical protein
VNEDRFQFSLRTLLAVITILAVCLAFVPWLTLACVCIAVCAGIALGIVEITLYFQRAFSWLCAFTFFLIGVAGFAFVAAVFLDKLPGYNIIWTKVLALIVFGGFAVISCYGSLLAYHEARNGGHMLNDTQRGSEDPTFRN